MKKYLTYLKISVSHEIEYRADVIVRIAVHLIPLVGFYFLWNAVYVQGAVFGTYSFNTLVTYFVVSSFINSCIPTYMVIDTIGEEIRTGFLSTSLIKPVNYALFKMAYFSGERFVRVIVSLVFIFISWLIFSGNLVFPGSILHWILFLVSTFLAMNLAYWVFFCLSIFGFWSNRIGGFAFSLEVINRFLNGSFLPLDLMPTGIQQILNILPFKYIIFFPVKLFSRPLIITDAVKGMTGQLFWLVLIYIISGFAWKIGLVKYESVGS